jgi:Siphovirus-type tail component, C-terminal domain
MNVEWDIPFLLTSPYGTFPFNEPEGISGMTLVLDPTKCSCSAPIRLTADNVSQGDGSILHREFVEGYQMRFGGWIMEAQDQPACAADLRSFWDELQRHLHALLGNDVALDGDNSRVQWTPTDYGQDRLLAELRLLEEAVAAYDGGVTSVTFAIHSRFPFAVDALEQTQRVEEGGGSEIVVNGGNAPAYPLFKFYGPIAGEVQISNLTRDQTWIYDTALPGASVILVGDYGLAGTFAQNVYLNGAGANLKPGVDVEQSDFWTLAPGPNTISVDGDSGVQVDIIWNNAWY